MPGWKPADGEPSEATMEEPRKCAGDLPDSSHVPHPGPRQDWSLRGAMGSRTWGWLNIGVQQPLPGHGGGGCRGMP